ncbi:MAG TPA: tRNA (adenosine(37)-N6)-threonylcarbamoyltransferase complex ATPase subunit type 1 TsaE [Solirubrobacteraceae bacterium]|jgi:tRNA threonylcarbamoyladenosine biosynthesis protein TsaE
MTQRAADSQVRLSETSSASETEQFGARLAEEVSAGEVVLLHGDLGAGKTTLVRGFARALGVTDPITSPTFAIGHRYAGSQVTIAHLDLYRVRELAAEDPGLLEDYLDAANITLVEWAEVAAETLPQARLRITLTHMGGERRRIEAVRLA